MTGHNQHSPLSSSSPAEPDDPLVVLEFSSFEEFLQDCSSRISEDGLFLEAEPRERVSSPLRFELRIRNGFRLLRGEGEVVRVHDPLPFSGEVAGVAVRFTSLDEASRRLLPVVLDHYRQEHIPLLDLAAEVSSVEVEVTVQGSADQEPVGVTLDDLWEEFEVVSDRQAVPLDEVERSAAVASDPLLFEAGQFRIEAERQEPGEDLESAASLLDEVESESEPLLVEVGRSAIEAERQEPGEDLESAASLLDEVESESEPLLVEVGRSAIEAERQEPGEDLESAAGLLDEVESESEPLLVEVGRSAIEAERQEPGEDLDSAAGLLDEVESDIEAEEAVTGDETEGEPAVAVEDEVDVDEEDATAEEEWEAPEEEALDLTGVLPEAPGEAASLELLPDEMDGFAKDSSSSLRQIRELWVLLLMAVLGILIGFVVYLGYRDGFEWPWSSGLVVGEPASTQLLAAYLEEVPEKPEMITTYDFEDPAQIGGKVWGSAGGETPAEPVTRPVVSRSGSEPESRPEQARTREIPPPRPTVDEVLTGVDRITWQESQDQTVLTLWGDGPFDTDQLVVYRLDTGTPRQVVRILGVSRPFSTRSLEVGTSHVSVIRTGLHAGDVGQELHVVADLEDPAVRMRRVEPEGSRLHVYFSKL